MFALKRERDVRLSPSREETAHHDADDSRTILSGQVCFVTKALAASRTTLYLNASSPDPHTQNLAWPIAIRFVPVVPLLGPTRESEAVPFSRRGMGGHVP